jgi:hypothetical protein
MCVMRSHCGRLGPGWAWLLYLAAVALAPLRMGVFTRTAGLNLSARYGMMDFYGNIYYPVRAFLDGVDPYDPVKFRALYPVEMPYPLHAPINLALHLPFGLLSPQAAGIAYFALSALLVLPLAYIALRLAALTPNGKVPFLAAGTLLSRPGHWDLVLGQRGVFLSLAVYVALLFARSNPLLSGTGIAVSMIKPTWGVPLTILLLAAGAGRAVARGVVLSAIVNIPVLMILLLREGGIHEFLQVLAAGQHAWATLPEVNPAVSYGRLDAATTLSRFLGYPLSSWAQAVLTTGILFIGAVALRTLRRRSRVEAESVAVAIICLGVLLCAYHNGYDLVLLLAPCVALLWHRQGVPSARWVRWGMITLFMIPAINWIASASVLASWQPSHHVWLFVTSVNGVCLALLFLSYSLPPVFLRPRGSESPVLRPANQNSLTS